MFAGGRCSTVSIFNGRHQLPLASLGRHKLGALDYYCMIILLNPPILIEVLSALYAILVHFDLMPVRISVLFHLVHS